jgi:hypothetical protein
MTKPERRIARELAAIYFIFAFIWGGSQMATEWGNVPQWITAGVAVSAVTVAAIGIVIQRSVARKRAAIDFFLKTEGDKQLLDDDNFWSGIETMKKMPINDFCTSTDLEVRKDYFAVRKYLNVHELVAIGIKNGMFDNQTCYDFWCGVLCRCVEAAQPVLKHVRARRAVYRGNVRRESIPKELLEPYLGHRNIQNTTRYTALARLDRPRVMAVICKLIAAGMAQHMGVRLDAQIGRVGCTLDHAGEARRR